MYGPDTVAQAGCMTQTLHRTDAQLKDAVTDELRWLPSVDSTHIGVAVNHGAITLSGEVESYPEKILAEKAVLRIRGVTAIAEEITVRSSWNGPNDADIAREAGEALERAVDIPHGMVTASVHEHEITLTGHLPWHYQREAASRAVRYLKGVTNVFNLISIKSTVSPAGIKTAIGAALVRGAQLENYHTTVTADDAGIVTLQGQVHSWTERQAAEHAAWSAPGVTDVLNQIRIQN
jgi:osmotically-inducible protein OsmY